MADNKAKIGRAMRFVASGGWTTEDPDVMGELLERAEALALAVAADPLASPDVRELAQDFLDRVKLDLA